MTRPVITLTTDFGNKDAYVAAMKGVILTICPNAQLVDISHQVPPQAVTEAAYLLSTAAPYFPPGTIHLAVVDPGVGTTRRVVAVATERAHYVAPDNGLLALTLAGDQPLQAVHLTHPGFHRSPVSATFHGRDILAPVAAHLACGVRLAEMGDLVAPATLQGLNTAIVPLAGAGPWLVHVLVLDHFGNVITNLHLPDTLPAGADLIVTTRDRRISGLRRTYADVPLGELLAYRGSSGYLELAMHGGSAAFELALSPGDTLLVERDEKAKSWNDL